MPLTEEERSRLDALAVRVAPLTQDELNLLTSMSGGASPTEDTAGTPESNSVLERALENLPGSIGRRFSETGEMVKNIALPSRESGNMLRALGQMAVGGLESLGGMFTPAVEAMPGNEREMFRNAVAGEARAFTPEGFAEDPTRAPATIAGLLAPASRAPGVLGRAAKAASTALDPVAASAELAGAAGRTASRAIPGVNTAIAEIEGVLTGRGGPRMREALESGRKGEGGRFREAIRADSPNMLGQTVNEGFQGEISTMGQRKRDFVSSYDQPIDVADLKASVLGDIANEGAGGILNDLGIRVRQATPESGQILVRGEGGSSWITLDVPDDFRLQDQGKLESVFRRFLEKPDQITLQELDDLKMGLDSAPVPSTARKAQRTVGEVRKAIRDRLGEVDGFDEVSNPLYQTYQTERAITERLEIPENALTDVQKANPQRTGDALVRAFNKSENQADKLNALEMTDLSVEGPIRSRAAAIGLQGLAPTDLVGRNQFFQQVGPLLGMGAVTAGAGMAGGAMGALLSLPVVATAFIPKYAASAMTRLGASERAIERVMELTRTAYQQADMLGINPQNMTVGQLLERLDSERDNTSSRPSMMSRIGSAANR